MALRMAAALPKIDALPAALISSGLQPSSRLLCALTGMASSAVMSRATAMLAAQQTLYVMQNSLDTAPRTMRGNQIFPYVATTTRVVRVGSTSLRCAATHRQKTQTEAQAKAQATTQQQPARRATTSKGARGGDVHRPRAVVSSDGGRAGRGA